MAMGRSSLKSARTAPDECRALDFPPAYKLCQSTRSGFGLIISHARHYLQRTDPDFEGLLRTLQTARDQGMLVAVTEAPVEHEIIDVRLLPNAPMQEPILGQPPAAEGPRPAAAVTPAQAQQMFNLVNSKLCCPAAAATFKAT